VIVNRRSIAFGVAIPALIACTSAEPPRVPPVVRDSAGVTIVENVAPEWTERTRWRLAETPELDIGGSERDTTQQFARIRGVHRMPSGSIAVVDAEARSVRFYDSGGTLLRSTGRRGDGPGEFPDQLIGTTFSCGTDSVFLQMPTSEVAIFSAPGSYVRTIRLETSTGTYAAPVGCLGDRIVGLKMFSAHPTDEGMYRDSLSLLLHSSSGEFIALIDTLPVHDATYRWEDGRLGYHPTPFGRTLVRAVGRNAIATGFGDSFAIELRDGSGALRRIARVVGRERPITDRDRQQYLDFALSRTPPEFVASARTYVESEFDMPGAMTMFPAFAQLRIDVLGNIWAREYDFVDAVVTMSRPSPWGRPRMRGEPSRWTVLSSDGRLLGDIVMPPRFQIHEIGNDWVLGVWRDELDVEHVRRYKLEKPN
jgi:hypothetical protein